MTFGYYKVDRQIGFARVAIDGATFAYIGYMFVLEEWSARGPGAWIVECITDHRDLGGLRRWMMSTADAHRI